MNELLPMPELKDGDQATILYGSGIWTQCEYDGDQQRFLPSDTKWWRNVSEDSFQDYCYQAKLPENLRREGIRQPLIDVDMSICGDLKINDPLFVSTPSPK